MYPIFIARGSSWLLIMTITHLIIFLYLSLSLRAQVVVVHFNAHYLFKLLEQILLAWTSYNLSATAEYYTMTKLIMLKCGQLIIKLSINQIKTY